MAGMWAYNARDARITAMGAIAVTWKNLALVAVLGTLALGTSFAAVAESVGSAMGTDWSELPRSYSKLSRRRHRFEIQGPTRRGENLQRLLLVEDHVSFRQTLALVFDQEPDFEVVAQAGTVAEARLLMADREVDLAVVDLSLPDGEGAELIEDLRKTNPHFAALVLTASLEKAEHAKAVEAGAAGVLHKSADVDEILDAARGLAAGETLLTPEELVELLRIAGQSREEEREAQASIERLTRRELEVLIALSEGLSNKQIAERLHMSVDTVRFHVVKILNKLEVHSRLQALLFAARHGLIELR